jgi:hypothetical protein
MEKAKRQKLEAAGWRVGSVKEFLATKKQPPKPPMRYGKHALERFIERWGPMPNAEQVLKVAVSCSAYHVENVPDENQSIWGFVVHYGPRKGEVALMVVAADGTVRTVLPSGSRRPAKRRPTQRRRSK